jgi:hypothetical protein
LRHETEGLIGSTDLLKNANRVMASGVKITSDQYVELVGNVFRLAKAAHVDGAQAINILTDALIRGNARGFQTVGIAINVKDAISEMAAASGQSTNTLENTAKRQAFYNELLQQTSAAVAKLPADYISIKDALERGELAWKGWFSAVGQAAGRSAVLQEQSRWPRTDHRRHQRIDPESIEWRRDAGTAGLLRWVFALPILGRSQDPRGRHSRNPRSALHRRGWDYWPHHRSIHLSAGPGWPGGEGMAGRDAHAARSGR